MTAHLVIAELLALVSRGNERVRVGAAQYVSDLMKEHNVRVIGISDELFLRGIEFYRQRPDKRYSLTDCVSMLICRDIKITNVLTSDHDFGHEGFQILLKA